MVRKVVVVLAACALAVATAPVPAGAAAAAAAPAAGAGDAAVAYANALALGNTTRAWQLLSAKSQKETNVVAWSEAFERRPAPVKPRPETLLRAICSAEKPPVVDGVAVREGESYLEVKGDVLVTQHVVVVKDPGGWRVDMAATDALNSREAGETFLNVMREETLATAGRAARSPASAQGVLTAMLVPQAKEYRLISTTPEGADRATVLVGSTVPVRLVLKAARAGLGWSVDLSRPLVPQVDVFSPDPLREAISLTERQGCEEQLRQLWNAVQAYANASDDMLPDPARWQDQLAPYLTGFPLHCPGDAVPGLSYAMNKNLAGKRRREVATPSLVPLFFESTKHARNAADTGETWPAQPRHVSGNSVLYLDGTVRPTPQKPSFEVKKAPAGASPSSPMRPLPGGVPGRPGMGPGTGPGGLPGGIPGRPGQSGPVRPLPQ